MNCPEHLVLDRRWLQIWHIQHADVPRRYITWAEVLNPLRYEICVGAGPGRYWHWNDDAWLWAAWRNFLFRVKVGCWLRGHDWVQNRYSDGDRCDRCFKQRVR